MTAALASNPWPMPQGALEGAAWRFGREVVVSEGAVSRAAFQWRLGRNCSIAPRQLAAAYGVLCLISLTVAAGFVSHGASMVLLFAAAELLAVGAALLIFARHAADRETITLVGRVLTVEHYFGARVERVDFEADWLTVEPAAGQGSLVQLSSRGRQVRVGRYLRPELRAAFAGELRMALRRAPVCPAPLADVKTDTN